MTPDKALFVLGIGGDGTIRYWRNDPPNATEEQRAVGGWRIDLKEASLMARAEALEVVGRLGLSVVGLVVQTNSFCEIDAVHDKGDKP